MNIIVCVTEVSRICGHGGVNDVTGELDPKYRVQMLNPYDEAAVEEALRIRENRGIGSVTVVIVGPARTERVLHWCLSMGADSAFHIINENMEDTDAWGTSQVLARFLSTREYDLLLFGRHTIDYGSGQVGTFVAELLGLPVVTSAVRIEVAADGKKATIHSALERGNRLVVETLLPAVLTADKVLNRPRYPTLPARLAVRNKPIQRVALPLPDSGAETVELPRTDIVKVAPAKLRPKKILSPDSNLSPSEKLKFMMRGGITEKKGGSVGGTPAQLAAGIIDFLRERKLLD